MKYYDYDCERNKRYLLFIQLRFQHQEGKIVRPSSMIEMAQEAYMVDDGGKFHHICVESFDWFIPSLTNQKGYI